MKKILNDENIEIDSFIEMRFTFGSYISYSFFCYYNNNLSKIEICYEHKKNSFNVSFSQGEKNITLPFPSKLKATKQVNKNFNKMLTRLIGV